jgi:aminopeptidase N
VAEKREYRLHLTQRVPDTAGQSDKQPMLIPVRVALMDKSGGDLSLRLSGSVAPATSEALLELRSAEQEFVFTDIPERPTASLLRGFSAPVRLEADSTDDDLLLRMAYDTDACARWEAAQTLAHRRITSVLEQVTNGQAPTLDPAFVQAFGEALSSSADPQLLGQALMLPAETVIADRLDQIDPSRVHEARSFVERGLAEAHAPLFRERYRALSDDGPYSVAPVAMGRRSLRNVCLRYLSVTADGRDGALALEQYERATNMTDRVASTCRRRRRANPPSTRSSSSRATRHSTPRTPIARVR